MLTRKWRIEGLTPSVEGCLLGIQVGLVACKSDRLEVKVRKPVMFSKDIKFNCLSIDLGCLDRS